MTMDLGLASSSAGLHPSTHNLVFELFGAIQWNCGRVAHALPEAEEKEIHKEV